MDNTSVTEPVPMEEQEASLDSLPSAKRKMSAESSGGAEAKKMKAQPASWTCEENVLYWKYFELFLPRCTSMEKLYNQVWKQFQKSGKNVSLDEIRNKWIDQTKSDNPKPLIERLLAQIAKNEALRKAKGAASWSLEKTETLLEIFVNNFSQLSNLEGSKLYKALSIRMQCEGFFCSAAEIESHWLYLLSTKDEKYRGVRLVIDLIFKILYKLEDLRTDEEINELEEMCTTEEVTEPTKSGKRLPLSEKDEVLYWKYFEYFLPQGTNANEICEKIWKVFLQRGRNYTLLQIREKWLEQVLKVDPKPLIKRLAKEINENADSRDGAAPKWTSSSIDAFFEVLEEMLENDPEGNPFTGEFSLSDEMDRYVAKRDKNLRYGDITELWYTLLNPKEKKHKNFAGAAFEVYKKIYKIRDFGHPKEIEQVNEVSEEKENEKMDLDVSGKTSTELMKPDEPIEPKDTFGLLEFLKQQEDNEQLRHAERMKLKEKQVDFLKNLIQQKQGN